MEYAVSKIQGVGWNPILQEYLKNDEAEFTSGYTMSSILIRKIVKNGQT
jgi:hypothetical protein